MHFSRFPVQLRSPPHWAPSSQMSQLGVCSRVHVTSPGESRHLPRGRREGPCHTRGLFQKPQSPGGQFALPPAASCQKHQFSITSEHCTPWEIALHVSAALFVSQNKADTKQDNFSCRLCLYKLRIIFLTPTQSPEVCAAQHRSRWFSCCRKMGFSSFQGLLSRWTYWIDNRRAQIPPLIQSHGVLIPKIQSELSWRLVSHQLFYIFFF